ncbi:MAG: methylmalonyl-CoA mutase family protein, partial [Frankiaceae bacterium]|nr:methylmalonyl-CoA mutase family protein [Frankiaceae bacterium]
MTGTSERADLGDIGDAADPGRGGEPGQPPAERSDRPLELAASFPPITGEEWERLAAAVLSRGGAALEPAAAMARLTSQTLDGIAIRPLYTAADAPGDAGLPGQAPYLRAATPAAGALSGWDIRIRVDAATAGDPAEAVLADLANGASSVWLQFADGARPGLDLAALAQLLRDVHLDLAPIVLDAGARAAEAAGALLELARERGIADGELAAVLGADPVGLAARAGSGAAESPGAPGSPIVDYAPLRALAVRVNGAYPRVRAAVVDATVFHEAGATDAQQLALALATGVAYLRELIGAGLSPAEAAAQLEFRYGVSDEQFPTIAALRAARRMWAQVTEASGVPGGAGQVQPAVTSWAMLSRHDLPVNILRGAVAAFAAGVGGAAAVTVLPFDLATGTDSVLSRRVARNTSALLIEESNIGRVIDPGGGSWYIEALSEDLAAAAWAIFQQIESAGGIAEALGSGWVSQQLSASRAKRDADLARRKIPLTGVSEFPNLAEPPPPGSE